MGASKIVASQGLAGQSTSVSLNTPDNSYHPTTGGRSFTEDSTRTCSSPTAHIITALVLAIIVGAGAAVSTYFLTQQNILYTALAGCGSFAITGLITYVMMRVCLGNADAPSSVVTTDELSHH